jgi:hypothetical protein
VVVLKTMNGVRREACVAPTALVRDAIVLAWSGFDPISSADYGADEDAAGGLPAATKSCLDLQAHAKLRFSAGRGLFLLLRQPELPVRGALA